MSNNNGCEIGLRPNQFCNLVDINCADIVGQADFNERAEAAAFIATLQAGYTDFHYLREVWTDTTQKDALIGVGLTGIASGTLDNLNLKKATDCVIATNEATAKAIGINAAARTNCVKPAGTSSLVLGCSSGIHAWHSPHYIRRVRVGKNEAIYPFLAENYPNLVADDVFRPHDQAVIEMPQRAPKGSVFRDEDTIDFLSRVKRFNVDWVAAGHKDGQNKHNVSCTVSVKDNEWEKVGEWMWQNREHYTGVSVLPFDGGSYVQAPFESCTEEVYDSMIQNLMAIDLSRVNEDMDNTTQAQELACAGGVCEIK